MPASQNRIPLAGSHRDLSHEARLAGPVDPNERVEVSIRLRRAPSAPPLTRGITEPLTNERRPLTHNEYRAIHSADPQDIAKIRAFAKQHKLDIIETSAARRTVRLAGTAAQMAEAFGVKLEKHEYPYGTYRGRTGLIYLPPELVTVVKGVFGLDNRPQAQPHFKMAKNRKHKPHSGDGTFTPGELAHLYDFPHGDGSGQTIGIIELGGGFVDADLDSYFAGIGVHRPSVTAVQVDGGSNSPTGNPDTADGEVMLDIEVAGAVASGAKLVVYFAPNTDAGFLDAITTAIQDSENNPSVISISWGSAEVNWTRQAMTNFDDAFQAAAALGVTICVASGDGGSADNVKPSGSRIANVDFPASSPNVLACGGTQLTASGTTITDEVVWQGDSGGGISDVFDLPDYQSNAQVPASANGDGRIGRGVPDVAGDADPNTGYQVRVDGSDMVIGGTSAVAPLWAGLTALLNQQLGRRVGFLNPVLYGELSSDCNDITSGSNGAYQAGPGWDACTGWGSPNGAALLKGLTGTTAAAAARGADAEQSERAAILAILGSHTRILEALATSRGHEISMQSMYESPLPKPARKPTDRHGMEMHEHNAGAS